MRRVMKRLKKRKASSGGRAASGIEEASEGDRSTKTFRAANRNEEEEENVGKKPEEEDEEEEEEEEGGREEEEEEEEEGEDEEEEVAAVDSMADRLQQEHINQPPKVLHDHGPYQAAPIHLLLQQALSLHQPHLPPPSSHMEEEDEEEEEEPHFPPSQQQQGPPFYFQLEMLPLEVALHIMSLLDVRSLCVASRVSRVYRRLAEDDTLWFALYRSRWMRSGSTCFVGYGWKQRYCERLGLNKKWNFEVNDQKFFRKPQVFEASRPTAKFSVRKLQVDDNLLVASVEHLSGDVCNSLQIWGLHTTSHESLYSVPAIVSFHFQGSLCVSGCSNGVVQVWDIGLNARPLGSFSLQPQTFGSMRERRPPRVTNVFIDMHESNCILASDSYSCVHLLDLRTGKPTKRLSHQRRFPLRVSAMLSARHYNLFTGLEDGYIFRWDLRNEKRPLAEVASIHQDTGVDNISLGDTRILTSSQRFNVAWSSDLSSSHEIELKSSAKNISLHHNVLIYSLGSAIYGHLLSQSHCILSTSTKLFEPKPQNVVNAVTPTPQTFIPNQRRGKDKPDPRTEDEMRHLDFSWERMAYALKNRPSTVFYCPSL